MSMKFTNKEKRDELVNRLVELAEHMQRSWDQGSDGWIITSDEMIGDIKTAACVVAVSEIVEEENS